MKACFNAAAEISKDIRVVKLGFDRGRARTDDFTCHHSFACCDDEFSKSLVTGVGSTLLVFWKLERAVGQAWRRMPRENINSSGGR